MKRGISCPLQKAQPSTRLFMVLPACQIPTAAPFQRPTPSLPQIRWLDFTTWLAPKPMA
jgi:hypothetical protein